MAKPFVILTEPLVVALAVTRSPYPAAFLLKDFHAAKEESVCLSGKLGQHISSAILALLQREKPISDGDGESCSSPYGTPEIYWCWQ